MNSIKLKELSEFGQSAWLDSISRSLIEKGRLKELIEAGVGGLTSNPTIFEKAISSERDYDGHIVKMRDARKTTFQIYDELTVKDIRDAADLFRPVYDKTEGRDGYVSLEINPLLASKIKESLEEGKRLFEKVARPNLMLKVPATEAGFEITERLLAEEINVNVTLIFSLEQYSRTAKAYINGLSALSRRGKDIGRIGSVASVFVSRLDTVVDKELMSLIDKKDGSESGRLGSLMGKAAAANSRIIYQKYLDLFSGDEFKLLKSKGAKPQRVLWGSTSTKNPSYSDIKYVAELIAKDTVNTVPENTLRAFMDHGVVKDAFSDYSPEQAVKVTEDLKALGIDINKICAELLKDGLAAFEKSFLSLLRSIEKKTKNFCHK